MTAQYPQGYLLHRSLYSALSEVAPVLRWRVSPNHSASFLADLEGGIISISPHAGNHTIEIQIHDHNGRLALKEASHQHDEKLSSVYEIARQQALETERVVEIVATELSDLAEQLRANPDTPEEGDA